MVGSRRSLSEGWREGGAVNSDLLGTSPRSQGSEMKGVTREERLLRP